MCAKQVKDTQTDFTRGGKRISDTSIPLYEKGLNKLSEWTLDPTKQIDTYLDKYYGNTAAQSDAIRDYERAMGNAASNLYATTHGGYSSAGDMSAANQQRAWNDYMARLRDQGVQNAASMYNTSVGNLGNSLNAYNSAYALGQPYSDIERYNYKVDQINSPLNQIAGVAGGAGKVLSAIPTPWTQAIGAGLQTFGNLASTEMGGISGQGSGAIGGQYGSWANIGDSVGRGLTATNALGGDNWITALFGGRNKGLITGTDLSGKPTITNRDGITIRS